MIEESDTNGTPKNQTINHKTHFGYRNVEVEEKAGLVRGVFDRVASRYDMMNDVMSLGAHRLWKEIFIKKLNLPPNAKLLDMAGGTGDIAFKALGHYANTHVTLCDINLAMLREGRKRAIDKNILCGIEWACGNAESLPFPDRSFDAYTIAFGIRNVTHIDHALAEAYRVLKPGGKFQCLEFSHVANPVLHRVYDIYSFHAIPKFGQWIANDAESYQYLVESIRKFPKQEAFATMIRQAGFSNVAYENLTFGAVAIHSGWRI